MFLSGCGRHLLTATIYRYQSLRLLGSLSNDDGDGNEDGKKAIGLDWQNNNSARASRFFVHFFAVVARLRRENAYVISSRFVEDGNTKQQFSFSFPEL